jgi:trimethylamine:corrinoid methyltransferase-like protein
VSIVQRNRLFIEQFYYPYYEIERLLLYSRYHLPVLVPLTPISGATTPYTLAGTVIHSNAAALSSLVLLQTICPVIPPSYYLETIVSIHW